MIARTPATTTTPATPRKWTLLLYSAADNDLKEYHLQNVADLERVGSDSHTSLVAQVDFGDRSSRYLIEKAARPDPDNIQTPPLETRGPLNMSDPKNLTDFLTWGIKNYPAEHYMVIISDHGEGWRGAMQDDSHEGWMSIPDLRRAFEAAQEKTATKIDIVGFDACSMASTEVAHELKDVCDFVIGSEDYEGSSGWPYSRIFNPAMVGRLRKMHSWAVTVEPRTLAVECVRHAAGNPEELPTMSAIETAKVPALTASLDALGKAILADPSAAAAVGEHADASLPFDTFHDAGDFVGRLAEDEDLPEGIRGAADEVLGALDHAVIAQTHAPVNEGATGLTLEASTHGIPERYADTRFARETSWPEALHVLQQDA